MDRRGSVVDRIRVTNARVYCTPPPRLSNPPSFTASSKRGECSWPSFRNPFRRHSDAFDAGPPIRRSRTIHPRNYPIVRPGIDVRRVMPAIATTS